MKKILFTTLLFFAFHSLQAQQAVSVPIDNYSGPKPVGMEKVESKYFCCAKCDFVAKKLQDCPVHNIPLVHVGDYYCPACGKHASSKPGTCPEHNRLDKVKMNMKYVVAQPPTEEKSGTTK
jgi:hypothetical protein